MPKWVPVDPTKIAEMVWDAHEAIQNRQLNHPNRISWSEQEQYGTKTDTEICFKIATKIIGYIDSQLK